MKTRKTRLTIFFITLLLVVVTGCRKVEDLSEEQSESNWAEKVGLDLDESSEELYQKALEEEDGKVVIYSISSRMPRVKESFERDYPGMTLETYNIDANDLSTRLKSEYDSGIRTADVIHSKEQTGEYTKDFFERGILHNYQPDSIFGNVDPIYLENLTPFFMETDWWFYNDAVYDQEPISNWWDVTKPEWSGNFVLQNPASTVSYMALFTTMIERADEMEEAYKEAYGEEIELAEDEPTAGHAWIKRALKNDPILFETNNELIQAVGEGTTSRLVGYSPSSKYREREDKGWNIQTSIENFSPKAGVNFLNFVAVVNEAPHPNGAKLLIRYLLGDEDGNGEGIQPFNTVGGWPLRPETTLVEGNVPLEDLDIWQLDYDYIYKNLQDVQDYWYEHR